MEKVVLMLIKSATLFRLHRSCSIVCNCLVHQSSDKMFATKFLPLLQYFEVYNRKNMGEMNKTGTQNKKPCKLILTGLLCARDWIIQILESQFYMSAVRHLFA